MKINQESRSRNLPFHQNINPLSYYVTGANSDALMDICDAYLGELVPQEKIAIIHVCSSMIIRNSLPDLTVDTRVVGVIPETIGKVLCRMKPAELACVIECILCNTQSGIFD